MALSGIRVIEFAGLAPAPYCGKILADFGADVIRVDRALETNLIDCLARGKRSIAVNLKHKDGCHVIRRLCTNADVLIDPFRPGTLERLLLGPNHLRSVNPGLIYTRITGYGQTGPLSRRAGHDINYLARSGLLSILGRHPEPPRPPVNLLADFAGGGMTTAFGIVLALLQRTKSGQGQVIDCSMTESAAYIGSWMWESRGLTGLWGNKRGQNALDGGCHFYQTYRTADDKYMSVGAIEPKFYADLLKGLGLTEQQLPHYHNEPDVAKKMLADIFVTKSREEWTEIFRQLDACVEPVFELDEAALEQHSTENRSYAKCEGGTVTPNPAPKMSERPELAHPAPSTGKHTKEILKEAGFTTHEIEQLLQSGAVEQQNPESKL